MSDKTEGLEFHRQDLESLRDVENEAVRPVFYVKQAKSPAEDHNKTQDPEFHMEEVEVPTQIQDEARCPELFIKEAEVPDNARASEYVWKR